MSGFACKEPPAVYPQAAWARSFRRFVPAEIDQMCTVQAAVFVDGGMDFHG
jgi:hypothetical protein